MWTSVRMDGPRTAVRVRGCLIRVKPGSNLHRDIIYEIFIIILSDPIQINGLTVTGGFIM